ncbi:MAG: HEAT repeat domain-containing protein [bacterium]
MKPLLEMLAKGKRSQMEDLDEVLQFAFKHEAIIADLVEFSAHQQANVAARAIWVLRKIAETSAASLATHKRHLLNRLTQSPHWEVKAELCHIIPALSLTPAETKQAINFFESCQNEASKIVRAWALNGLYEMSKLSPSLIPRVSGLLNEALKSDIPSIRERARNILKELE